MGNEFLLLITLDKATSRLLRAVLDTVNLIAIVNVLIFLGFEVQKYKKSMFAAKISGFFSCFQTIFSNFANDFE
jgi:hypothetical protein